MKLKLSELKAIVEEEIIETMVEQELQEMFGMFKSKKKPKEEKPKEEKPIELPDGFFKPSGRTFRLQGQEDDAKTAVEMSETSNRLKDKVVFKVLGSGLKEYEEGKVYALPRDNFEQKFVERKTEDGVAVNVYNLDPNLPSPAAVMQGLSEGLQHHINTTTPLTKNIYRIGSDEYFNIIREARVEYKKGTYKPLNEEEQEMLESDLGEWVMFEGESVPLDFPMYEETLEEAKKKKKKKDPPIGKPTKNTGGGKKYKVFVRNPKTGKIKKITYGDSKGGLKGNWNSAEARASFASRHNCAEKKDRTKAGYWACRAHKDFGTNVPGRFW